MGVEVPTPPVSVSPLSPVGRGFDASIPFMLTCVRNSYMTSSLGAWAFISQCAPPPTAKPTQTRATCRNALAAQVATLQKGRAAKPETVRRACATRCTSQSAQTRTVNHTLTLASSKSAPVAQVASTLKAIVRQRQRHQRRVRALACGRQCAERMATPTATHARLGAKASKWRATGNAKIRTTTTKN